SQMIVGIHVEICASVHYAVLKVSAITSISLPAGVEVSVIFASLYLSASPAAHVKLACVSLVSVAADGDAAAATFASLTVTFATPLVALARASSLNLSVPVGIVGGMGNRSSQVASASRDALTPSPSSCEDALPPAPA